MSYQLEKQVVDRLKVFFDHYDFIDKVVIFGSRAKHNANPKSDIDLCIYSLEMSDVQFSKLKLSLDELPILYKIDVVHFEKSNEALRENIERDGKLLFVKVVKLEDVIELQNGYAFKSQEFKPTGIPVIRITNVDNNGLILDSLVYYSEDAKLEKFLLKKGDILLALTGDDKTLKICMNHLEKPLYLNQRVAILRAKEKIDQQYLLYAMKKNSKALLSKAKGIAQKNISADDINTLEINLPSLTKQNEIAKKLDKASELIALRKASIKKLDELSKAIFIDMFGDPAKNLHNLDIVEFGTVVKIDAPMVDPNTPKYENLLHIGPDRIERNTGKLLPALTAKEEGLISKKFLFDDKYILYSKIRPYLNKVTIVNFIGLCSADMYPIRPLLDKTNREYLLQLLLSSYFLKYTETLPDRASIPKLNRKELAKFEFPLPPIELQNQFAQTIEKVESQKSLYEAELTKLQENFDALMAQSFEG